MSEDKEKEAFDSFCDETKETEDARKAGMNREQEIVLYERVTRSKTKYGSMGVTLTPRKEGNRWSLKIDIPIDVLKKWMGEEKKDA